MAQSSNHLDQTTWIWTTTSTLPNFQKASKFLLVATWNPITRVPWHNVANVRMQYMHREMLFVCDHVENGSLNTYIWNSYTSNLYVEEEHLWHWGLQLFLYYWQLRILYLHLSPGYCVSLKFRRPIFSCFQYTPKNLVLAMAGGCGERHQSDQVGIIPNQALGHYLRTSSIPRLHWISSIRDPSKSCCVTHRYKAQTTRDEITTDATCVRRPTYATPRHATRQLFITWLLVHCSIVLKQTNLSLTIYGTYHFKSTWREFKRYRLTSSRSLWRCWNRCKWKIVWREFSGLLRWWKCCSSLLSNSCFCSFHSTSTLSYIACTIIWWRIALEVVSRHFVPRHWASPKQPVWKTVPLVTLKWHSVLDWGLQSIRPCNKRGQQMQQQLESNECLE